MTYSLSLPVSDAASSKSDSLSDTMTTGTRFFSLLARISLSVSLVAATKDDVRLDVRFDNSIAMSCELAPCGGGDVTPAMFLKTPVKESDTRVNSRTKSEMPMSQACCDTISHRGMSQGLRLWLQPSADAYQSYYATMLTSYPEI